MRIRVTGKAATAVRIVRGIFFTLLGVAFVASMGNIWIVLLGLFFVVNGVFQFVLIAKTK